MSVASLNTFGGPTLDLGYAGQLTTDQPSAIMTRDNETTTGGSSTATPGLLDFGIAVARGVNAECCKRIAADADLPIGITVRNPTMSPDGNQQVGYAPTMPVGIAYQGCILAIAAENVTDGDQVLSLTAGAASPSAVMYQVAGALAGPTGGLAGSGRVVVPGAQWCTTTAAGKVGKIRLTGVNSPKTTVS